MICIVATICDTQEHASSFVLNETHRPGRLRGATGLSEDDAGSSSSSSSSSSCPSSSSGSDSSSELLPVEFQMESDDPKTMRSFTPNEERAFL